MKIIRAPQLVRINRRYTIRLVRIPDGPDGLHGHLRVHEHGLEVGITGVPLDAPNHPDDDMVMAFGDLDRIVQTHVMDHYDHTLVLREDLRDQVAADHAHIAGARSISWQPTYEKLLIDIVERLRPHLPAEVELSRLSLSATAGRWVDWEL